MSDKKIREFQRSGARIRVNTKNLRIITTEDIEVNGEPVLVGEDGEVYIQANMVRHTDVPIGSNPSTIVGIYHDDVTGVNSAESEIVANMTEEERQSICTWTFEVRGFNNYRRLSGIEIWVDGKLKDTIREDGMIFEYIRKESKVVIKLVDAKDWQSYCYKNGVFEVRDMIHDVEMITHGKVIDENEEGQFGYYTDVEMELETPVSEDRHFRFHYFDLQTVQGTHFGIEIHKATVVYPKKSYDTGKSYIWSDLGFCSGCRLQSDLLEFKLIDGHVYDEIESRVSESGGSRLEEMIAAAPLPKDMKCIGYKVDPADKGYAQYNIEIKPSAINKKFGFWFAYGQIRYLRPFTVKLADK